MTRREPDPARPWARAVGTVLIGAALMVAVLVSCSPNGDGPDAGSAGPQTMPPATGVGCPSSTPYPGPARQRPATPVHFYWNGVLYLEASGGAATATPARGEARFTITCMVNDPPELQDWVTPWPNGAAGGLLADSVVHRAAGSSTDCVLIAQTVWGDWRAFAPDGPVAGCP